MIITLLTLNNAFFNSQSFYSLPGFPPANFAVYFPFFRSWNLGISIESWGQHLLENFVRIREAVLTPVLFDAALRLSGTHFLRLSSEATHCLFLNLD